MMEKVYSFVGEIGVGKTYQSLKKMEELKADGHVVMSISWASELKQTIEKCLGWTKTGSSDRHMHINSDDIYDMLRARILGMCVDQLCTVYEGEPLILHTKTCIDNFHAAWDKSGPLLIELFDSMDQNEHSSSFRTMIQTIGTEIGRATKDDLWIRAMLDKIQAGFDSGLITAVLIDDTRFLNEYDALAEFGERNEFPVEWYGVEAPIEVRAKRMGLHVSALVRFAKHDSERFVPEIISRIPPGNLIWNA